MVSAASDPVVASSGGKAPARNTSTAALQDGTRYEEQFPERAWSLAEQPATDVISPKALLISGIIRDTHGVPVYDPNPDLNNYILRGFRTDHGEYHRMEAYSGTVSGVMSFFTRTIQSAPWHFAPPSDETPQERKARELCEWAMGMQEGGDATFEGGLRRLIFHACRAQLYGFSALEVSPDYFDWDGRRVLSPARIKWVAPWSVDGYIVKDDEVRSLVQVQIHTSQTYDARKILRNTQVYGLGGAKAEKEVVIPIERLLIFQHDAVDGNIEGRSMFRSAWAWWRAMMDTLLRDQSALDRLFDGLFIASEDGDGDGPYRAITQADREYMKAAINNVRYGLTNELLVPYGIKLTPTWPTFNKPSPIEEYKYYDHQIMICALSGILGLNSSAAASRGLSDGMMAVAYNMVDSIASDIAATINGDGRPWTGLVRRLVDWNIPNFKGRYPKINQGTLSYQDIEKLVNILTKAQQFLIFTPDEHDEVLIRRALKMGTRSPEALKKARERVAQRSKSGQDVQGGQTPSSQPLKPGEGDSGSKSEPEAPDDEE